MFGQRLSPSGHLVIDAVPDNARVVDLSRDSGLLPSDIPTFFRSLRLHANLNVLCVDGSIVLDAGAVVLASFLMDNRTLTVLDLSTSFSSPTGVNECVTSVGSEAIGSALLTNNCVMMLNLCGNDLLEGGPAGLYAISQAVCLNGSVRSLNLSQNRIGSAYNPLLHVVENAHSLTDLNLSGCGLPHAAGASLAAALRSNPGLTSLDCSDNWKPWPYALSPFVEAAKMNRRITTLLEAAESEQALEPVLLRNRDLVLSDLLRSTYNEGVGLSTHSTLSPEGLSRVPSCDDLTMTEDMYSPRGEPFADDSTSSTLAVDAVSAPPKSEPIRNTRKLLRTSERFHLLKAGAFQVADDLDFNCSVDYSDLDLRYIPPIFLEPYLQGLLLFRNQLDSLPRDALRAMVDLKRLDLHANSFRTLPSSLRHARQLTHLDVSHNRLTGAYCLPKALSGLQSLSTLLLTHNIIDCFPPVILLLSNLSILDLSYNDIAELPSGLTKSLPLLSKLYLVHNRLARVPADLFAHGLSLTDVMLDVNNLQYVPIELCHATNLANFSFSGNPLSAIPKQHTSSLPALKRFLLGLASRRSAYNKSRMFLIGHAGARNACSRLLRAEGVHSLYDEVPRGCCVRKRDSSHVQPLVDSAAPVDADALDSHAGRQASLKITDISVLAEVGVNGKPPRRDDEEVVPDDIYARRVGHDDVQLLAMLQLWDFGGSGQLPKVVMPFFLGGEAIIIVFASLLHFSTEHNKLMYRLNLIEATTVDCPVVLVGAYSDRTKGKKKLVSPEQRNALRDNILGQFTFVKDVIMVNCSSAKDVKMLKLKLAKFAASMAPTQQVLNEHVFLAHLLSLKRAELHRAGQVPALSMAEFANLSGNLGMIGEQITRALKFCQRTGFACPIEQLLNPGSQDDKALVYTGHHSILLDPEWFYQKANILFRVPLGWGHDFVQSAGPSAIKEGGILQHSALVDARRGKKMAFSILPDVLKIFHRLGIIFPMTGLTPGTEHTGQSFVGFLLPDLKPTTFDECWPVVPTSSASTVVREYSRRLLYHFVPVGGFGQVLVALMDFIRSAGQHRTISQGNDEEEKMEDQLGIDTHDDECVPCGGNEPSLNGPQPLSRSESFARAAAAISQASAQDIWGAAPDSSVELHKESPSPHSLQHSLSPTSSPPSSPFGSPPVAQSPVESIFSSPETKGAPSQSGGLKATCYWRHGLVIGAPNARILVEYLPLVHGIEVMVRVKQSRTHVQRLQWGEDSRRGSVLSGIVDVIDAVTSSLWPDRTMEVTVSCPHCTSVGRQQSNTRSRSYLAATSAFHPLPKNITELGPCEGVPVHTFAPVRPPFRASSDTDISSILAEVASLYEPDKSQIGLQADAAMPSKCRMVFSLRQCLATIRAGEGYIDCCSQAMPRPVRVDLLAPELATDVVMRRLPLDMFDGSPLDALPETLPWRVVRTKTIGGELVAVHQVPLPPPGSDRLFPLLRTTTPCTIERPFLVQCCGWTDDSSSLFIVSEYPLYGTLHQFLRDDNVILWDHRLRIAIQLACGLATHHYAVPSIVHGNVSSQNVWMTGSEEQLSDVVTKLGPPGLLCWYQSRNLDQPTVMGSTFDTRYYAALIPEFHAHGEASSGGMPIAGATPSFAPASMAFAPSSTTATDVYAFGLLLYELLEGKLPLLPSRGGSAVHSRGSGLELTDEVTETIRTKGAVAFMEFSLPQGSASEQYVSINFRSLLQACLQPEPGDRPSIGTVMVNLTGMWLSHRTKGKTDKAGADFTTHIPAWCLKLAMDSSAGPPTSLPVDGRGGLDADCDDVLLIEEDLQGPDKLSRARFDRMKQARPLERVKSRRGNNSITKDKEKLKERERSRDREKISRGKRDVLKRGFKVPSITSKTQPTTPPATVDVTADSAGLLHPGTRQFDQNISPGSDCAHLLGELNLRHSGSIHCMIVHTGRVWAGCGFGKVHVWDVETRSLLSEQTAHASATYCLLVVNGRIWSGSSDGTIKIWNPVTLGCAKQMRGKPVNCMLNVKEHVWAGSSANALQIWSKDTFDVVDEVSTPDAVSSLLQVDKYVWAGSYRQILILDVITRAVVKILTGHTGPVPGMVLTSAGTVWSYSSEKSIVVWNEEGDCTSVGDPAKHSSRVMYLLPSADAEHIWSSDWIGRNVVCWNVKTAEPVCKLETHHKDATRAMVEVVHDGVAELWTASWDKTVRIWNMDEFKASKGL